MYMLAEESPGEGLGVHVQGGGSWMGCMHEWRMYMLAKGSLGERLGASGGDSELDGAHARERAGCVQCTYYKLGTSTRFQKVWKEQPRIHVCTMHTQHFLSIYLWTSQLEKVNRGGREEEITGPGVPAALCCAGT